MKDVLLELLNLSVFELFGSGYLMTATLSGLLSGAAGAYITHLLIRRNQNSSKFEDHFRKAMEHVNLANLYWNRGEICISAEEMKEAGNTFLKASIYADNINHNWCEILANNLLNQSRIIKKAYSKQIIREEAEKIQAEVICNQQK